MAKSSGKQATPSSSSSSSSSPPPLPLPSPFRPSALITGLLVLILALLAAIILQQTNKDARAAGGTAGRPIAWVTGPNMHHGYLAHVMKVFEEVGYEVIASTRPPPRWDVLWSHDYPFSASFNLPQLSPLQKVNHFPGSGFITNKLNLATSGLKYVPKAFNLPREAEGFLQYAREHPAKMWVQKDNNHRGIRVVSTEQIDLAQTGTFVQEYIDRPLLIDGKKFDIGLYVTMTSLNPLRVYVYDNDALLRFCAEPYPVPSFNASLLDGYVVGDRYTPVWLMPSLAPYFVGQQLNSKHSLNAYITAVLGKDPALVWSQMEESIRTIYQMMEGKMGQLAEMYPHKSTNFFEMVRFDFTLDADLQVYLMEANMSPNMASAKYPPNREIYEPVLYSLLSLTGLTRLPGQTRARDWDRMPSGATRWDMLLLERDLSVLPEICSSAKCHTGNLTGEDGGLLLDSACSTVDECDICSHCLSGPLKAVLKASYLEELSRWHNRRLLPSTSIEPPPSDLVAPTISNYLLEKWFIGKCLLDGRWCN